MAPTTAPTINLTAGRLGYLTAKETDMLKRTWGRLLELFKQPGKAAATETSDAAAPKKSGSFFGMGRKKAEEPAPKELFIGATKDPQWMSLPLEKAIPLIPGAELERTFWRMVNTDNPDAVLLRFLRARKWDEDAAYNMLINTLRWRLWIRVDDIISLGETGLKNELNRLKPGMGDQFITNLFSGKAYLGGPDNEGRGICFINVRFHYKEDQAPEVIKLLTLYVMETSRFIVRQPVESSCIVFNMEGFTLANMDFDFVKFLVGCFEAYYPETLGQCLIHKAPWVFSTIWGLITPLLDPVVASKIAFTKNLAELTARVPEGALPSFITGDPEKKTRDEKVKIDTPPAPGTLEERKTPAVQELEELLKEYTAETTEWVKTKTPIDGKEDLSRRALAKQTRQAIIKANDTLRGKTNWELKGLVTVTPEHRLILDYGNPGWVPLDITEVV